MTITQPGLGPGESNKRAVRRETPAAEPAPGKTADVTDPPPPPADAAPKKVKAARAPKASKPKPAKT